MDLQLCSGMNIYFSMVFQVHMYVRDAVAMLAHHLANELVDWKIVRALSSPDGKPSDYT